jgi:flagellar L-ring protein precursor FlgH
MRSAPISFASLLLVSVGALHAQDNRRGDPLAPRASASPSEMMRRNNGSLMRATLAMQPPPAAGTLRPADPLEGISFFHVPPPEPRTIRKHDLITIIIREESQSKTNAKADLSREAEFDARLEEFIKFASGLQLTGGGVTEPVPSIKASGEREFQGDGKVDRTDSITARIQAEVIDVKPNGTLVVQARKRIRSDDDEQTFILSGICRAEDVTADNTLLSTQLFDLEFQKSTSGPVRDSVKRGNIHRFLDWLNPF